MSLHTLRRFIKSIVARRVYAARGQEMVAQARGIVILMYHEIALRGSEVFRHFPVLCTAPDSFEAQLQWLRQHFECIDIDEAARRLTDGSAGNGRAVVITSDDGWMGFHQHAVPLLSAAGVPATVYVTTSVLDGKPPWYVRWRIMLWYAPRLLQTLAHELGRLEPFSNADEAITYLKRLDLARIERLWKYAVEEFGEPRYSPANWFVREGHVREAIRSGVVIGAHTENHPILPNEPEHTASEEIERSRRRLQELTRQPIKHFAYPNGDHSDREVALVQQAGFATAVTTRHGWNMPGQDLYRLSRVDVHEAACVDHRGRFSEAMFALWIGGEWHRIARRWRL